MVMIQKATQGRKKIAIRKIEERNNRQVTFSKRRGGLFKKASELCVLTGVQIAILVRSQSGRVFAFGHPNTDQLLDKYLNGTGTGSSSTCTTSSKHKQKGGINHNRPPPPMIMNHDFNQHYMEMSKELEEEKKKKNVIQESKMVNGAGGMFWWDERVDGLELEALKGFVPSLEELKKKVLMRVDELVMIKASSSSSLLMTSSSNQIVGLENGMIIADYGTTDSLGHLGFDF